MVDPASDPASTFVGTAERNASDCANNLEAAYLMHPEWRKIQNFRQRALSLRDDIAAWLQGEPT